MARQHNFGLDLVRAAAILLVLFDHTSHWWVGEQRADVIGGFWGAAGVDLFFSLSGFLIGGILLRTEPRGPGEIVRFWGRRWMRTLPAYWAMLVLLQLYFGVVAWRDYVFMQSFVPMTEWTPLMPQAWSLVLEEWFYVLVPVLLAGLAAVPWLRRRGLAVPAACALLVVGEVAARAWVRVAMGAEWSPDLELNPVLRLDCAAFGLLGAWAVRRWPMRAWVAWACAVGGAAGIAGTSVVWMDIFYAPERLPGWGAAWWLPGWVSLFPTVMEGAGALVVLGLQRLAPRGGWAGQPVQALAALSYALYLVHVPVFDLLDARLSHAVGVQLLAVAVAVGSAVALRLLVERPALAVRDRVLRDRPGVEVSRGPARGTARAVSP